MTNENQQPQQQRQMKINNHNNNDKWTSTTTMTNEHQQQQWEMNINNNNDKWTSTPTMTNEHQHQQWQMNININNDKWTSTTIMTNEHQLQWQVIINNNNNEKNSKRTTPTTPTTTMTMPTPPATSSRPLLRTCKHARVLICRQSNNHKEAQWTSRRLSIPEYRSPHQGEHWRSQPFPHPIVLVYMCIIHAHYTLKLARMQHYVGTHTSRIAVHVNLREHTARACLLHHL